MQCPELAGAKFSEGDKLKKARQDVTTMGVHAAGLRSRGTGNGATRLKSNDKRSVAEGGRRRQRRRWWWCWWWGGGLAEAGAPRLPRDEPTEPLDRPP